MVAEVSLHNAEFIMRHMPIARCYQFRTIWFDKHGIAWRTVGDGGAAEVME